MKKILLISALCFLLVGLQAQTKTFYDYNCQNLNNQTISLSQYAGKKLMVANVASYCVYTPEYTPLEQLYEQYKKYNFMIIGFPSNDFLSQGGTDSEIISVCHTFDVNFAIMQEIHVDSGSIAPVYQWLETDSLNGVSNATITWNFNKFLIDEHGHWVRWFDSPVSPLDTAITNWIIQDSTAGKLAYRKPSAYNDTAIVLQGTIDTMNIAVNDSDESGDSLCITSVFGSANFKIADCSNVVYTGPTNFTGADTCWYVICTDSAPVVCDTAMISVTVNALTSAINNINNGLKVSLYPNPTASECTLQLKGNSAPLTATIIDVTGREVLPLFNQQQLTTFNFSTASLSSGFYFVKITDLNQQASLYKLVKE